MKNHHLAKLAIVAAASLAAGVAGAADLAVTASIASECAVEQNAAIAFGALSTLNGVGASTTNSVATGSVNAICTNGATSPTFKYSSANSSGSNFRMIGANSTDFIAYTLHQDSDGSSGAVSYNTDAAYPGFSADGTVKVLPLTGKIIPAEKNGKTKQGYTDTITVTVSFGA